MTDAQLLSLIAKGNDLAFTHFYDRHRDSLFIAAHKVLKEEAACQDIIQEVFLIIWQHDSPDKIENAPAYLNRLVRNQVLMRLRKIKLSEQHLKMIAHPIANTTEETIMFKELNHQLQDSIGNLPPKCQEVFKLSREQNLSNQQIATQLNLSLRTVETHISNALKRIKTWLETSTAITILLTTLFS